MRSPAPAVQPTIATYVLDWILRHGLIPSDRAAVISPIIATITCRCSPGGRDQNLDDQHECEVVAMFLALFFALDDQPVQHQDAQDVVDQVRSLIAMLDHGSTTGDHPWQVAVSEFFGALIGMLTRSPRHLQTTSARLKKRPWRRSRCALRRRRSPRQNSAIALTVSCGYDHY